MQNRGCIGVDLVVPFWANYAHQILLLVRQELLLFSAVWIIVGAIDEIVLDIVWIGLHLTGRARSVRAPEDLARGQLLGKAAVFVPAWREVAVIGAMVAHTLRAWEQRDYVLYVGCYRNDPDTFAAARSGGGSDPRLRLVVVDVGIM